MGEKLSRQDERTEDGIPAGQTHRLHLDGNSGSCISHVGCDERCLVGNREDQGGWLLEFKDSKILRI